MRITENLGSDFKHLGQNHLIALGFAAAGFTIAYGVNKACLWFFAEKDNNRSQEDKNKENIKKLVFTVVAFGVSMQTNAFIESIAYDLNIKSQLLNKNILILHVVSFALASLIDQKKVCMGIIFSATLAYIHPRIAADGAACFGSLLDYMMEN